MTFLNVELVVQMRKMHFCINLRNSFLKTPITCRALHLEFVNLETLFNNAFNVLLPVVSWLPSLSSTFYLSFLQIFQKTLISFKMTERFHLYLLFRLMLCRAVKVVMFLINDDIPLKKNILNFKCRC